MDLSVPFFGNPSISRQGDKGRQNLKKEYESTWLDTFLEGFFGGDAPAGSVLDPQADKKQTAKDIGRRAGVVTDLASPAKAALLGALPALAGAIRIGGAKDLMLSHAFDPRNAPKIAESGFLSAPSLAITSNSSNTFDKSRPQFVFRAGSVTPEQYPSSLINRDGWFSNPTGLRDGYSKRDEFNFPKASPEWSNKAFRESLKQELKAAKAKDVFHDDLRLGQYSSPHDYDAKALAIFASPKFEDLRSFEKSLEGAPLLRHSNQASHDAWDAADEYAYSLSRQFGGNPTETIIQHLRAGKPLEDLPEELQTLYKIQSRSPSDMAEFKIFDKLPLSPENAFIYVGSGVVPYSPANQREFLQQLAPLQANGFKVMSQATLWPPDVLTRANKFPQTKSLPSDFMEKTLPRIPNSKGTFSFERTGLLDPEIKMNSQEILGNPTEVAAFQKLLHQANFDAPKLGGSPPLSTVRTDIPRVSDQTAAIAQKLLENPRTHISAEDLRGAEILVPGVVQKLAAVEDPNYRDLYHAMGHGGDDAAVWEAHKLLHSTVKDLQVGKVPLIGPPAPPKLTAPAVPPVGSFAHYQNIIKTSKEGLYSSADEFYDIAEAQASVLKNAPDLAAFWEKAKKVGDHMQANWAAFANPHDAFEKAMKDVLAEVVGKP